MNQTRTQSLIEVIVNVSIGYVIATAAQLLVFPMFGIHISIGDQLLISLIFTAISVLRGYIIRRWFNCRIQQFAKNMTE